MKKVSIFLIMMLLLILLALIPMAGCHSPSSIPKNTSDSNSNQKEYSKNERRQTFANQSKAIISIRKDGFHPSKLEIKAGTKVIWRNEGLEGIIIHENNDKFKSPALKVGESFIKEFPTQGTISYHGMNGNMTGDSMDVETTGTIIVK